MFCYHFACGAPSFICSSLSLADNFPPTPLTVPRVASLIIRYCEVSARLEPVSVFLSFLLGVGISSGVCEHCVCLTPLFSQLPRAASPLEGSDASELEAVQPPQGHRLSNNP